MCVCAQLPSVFVNCVECFSARFLYEHILTNLPSGGSCSLPPTSAACDNMNDFVRSLVVEVSSRHLEEETLYIVSTSFICEMAVLCPMSDRSVKKIHEHLTALSIATIYDFDVTVEKLVRVLVCEEL